MPKEFKSSDYSAAMRSMTQDIHAEVGKENYLAGLATNPNKHIQCELRHAGRLADLIEKSNKLPESCRTEGISVATQKANASKKMSIEV